MDRWDLHRPFQTLAKSSIFLLTATPNGYTDSFASLIRLSVLTRFLVNCTIQPSMRMLRNTMLFNVGARMLSNGLYGSTLISFPVRDQSVRLLRFQPSVRDHQGGCELWPNDP